MRSMSQSPSATAAPEAAVPNRLTGPQKAALVVRLLALEGASISLKDLPESVQASLIREVGTLGEVDMATVAAVAQEFAARLNSQGSRGVGGLDKAIELLGEAISPEAAERVRRHHEKVADDPWERVREAEAEALKPIVELQDPLVAAVILSNIGVSVAASLIGLLPGEQARHIAYGVSQTKTARPDAVHRIGVALDKLLADRPADGTEVDAGKRVGAILNFSRSATRNAVLDGLIETDADFAEDVRRAIFTFADIPARLEERDVPKVLRGVAQDALSKAFKGAEGANAEAKDFILGAVTQRMADQIREEMEEMGEVSEDDADDAMSSVVMEIRRLEEEGEIRLKVLESA